MTKKKQCVSCGKSDIDVPLLSFEYKGSEHGICPQCLPLLIHAPVRLAEKLPGLEKISPPTHKEHR